MNGTFTLNIDLGNDEMQNPQHVAAALRELANKLDQLDTSTTQAGAKILDDNGNDVGKWEYEAELEDDDEEDDGN